MFKFNLGVVYKGVFYGVKFGGKKKKVEKPIVEEQVKVLIQNHPVYEKFATLFRQKVLNLVNSSDYSLISARMVGENEVFSYAGIDFLKVDPVEYIDATDKLDKKKHYLIMKITINELATVTMSDSLPN